MCGRYKRICGNKVICVTKQVWYIVKQNTKKAEYEDKNKRIFEAEVRVEI